MEHRIALIAEHSDGKLNPVSYELVSFARELKGTNLSPPTMLILGDEVATLAREASRITGLDVIALEAPGLVSYNSEVYKCVLSNVLEKLNPTLVCAAHTSTGTDFAPSLAIRLDAACITSVEAIREENGRLLFLRPFMGGKIQAVIASLEDTTVVTVQPGRFERNLACSESGKVEVRTVTYHPKTVQSLAVKTGLCSDSNLSEAKVIVSAGRGVKKQENLDLVFDLAKMFPQSSVACSRPLCDVGWLEYRHQVGLTGATVNPSLYIACGISGAQQHLMGMQGSGFVVAINTDPNAAIFNHADVCIVHDLVEFLPELIRCLRRASSKKS